MGHRIQQWVMLGYRVPEDLIKGLPKIAQSDDPFEALEAFNCSHNYSGKMNVQLCFTHRAGKEDVVIGRCLGKSGYAQSLGETVSISVEKAQELKPFIDGLLEAVFDYDFSQHNYGFHFVSDYF